MGNGTASSTQVHDRMAIRIGCGSWADPEYVGVLYPKGLPAKDRLKVYAEHFNHVEINSSAYATPRLNVVKQWIDHTPEDFTFDIKLHRAFSRNPEKVARESSLLGLLLASAKPLMEANKLGAFFLVLSSDFNPESHRLAELDVVVDKLQPHLLAVELRHRDWVTGKERDNTLEYFRKSGVVLINVDMPRIPGSSLMPPLTAVTQPKLVSFRLHGRNPGYLEAKSAAEGHTYAYSQRELKEIVTRVEEAATEASDVHLVANNHAQDFAPKTALALQKLLGISPRLKPAAPVKKAAPRTMSRPSGAAEKARKAAARLRRDVVID